MREVDEFASRPRVVISETRVNSPEREGDELSARGPSGSKVVKAAEKYALNPQGMTDRDQRKNNRDNAIKMLTGNEERVQSGGGGGRHPDLQKALDKAHQNAYGGRK